MIIPLVLGEFLEVGRFRNARDCIQGFAESPGSWTTSRYRSRVVGFGMFVITVMHPLPAPMRRSIRALIRFRLETEQSIGGSERVH